MILESLLSVIVNLITFVLDMLPNLPDVPEDVSNAIFNGIDLIFDNVGLLGVFVPLTIMKVIIPLWLGIEAFDKIYSIVFWVIRKLPFLDIKE